MAWGPGNVHPDLVLIRQWSDIFHSVVILLVQIDDSVNTIILFQKGDHRCCLLHQLELPPTLLDIVLDFGMKL